MNEQDKDRVTNAHAVADYLEESRDKLKAENSRLEGRSILLLLLNEQLEASNKRLSDRIEELEQFNREAGFSSRLTYHTENIIALEKRVKRLENKVSKYNDDPIPFVHAINGCFHNWDEILYKGCSLTPKVYVCSKCGCSGTGNPPSLNEQ